MASHTQDSWTRNYESVEPLLHPRAGTDSPDEEDFREEGPSATSHVPTTPPKNQNSSTSTSNSATSTPTANQASTAISAPNGMGNNVRLPMPARAYTNTRGPSAASASGAIPASGAGSGPGSSPFPSLSSPAANNNVGQGGTSQASSQTTSGGGRPLFGSVSVTGLNSGMGSGSGGITSTASGASSGIASGSGNLGLGGQMPVGQVSQPPYLPFPAATTTSAPTTVSPRSPRSSSFKSSPLASSASSPALGGSSGMNGNMNNGNNGAYFSPSTTASPPGFHPSSSTSSAATAVGPIPNSNSASSSSTMPVLPSFTGTSSSSIPGMSASTSMSPSSSATPTGSPPTSFPSPFTRPNSRGGPAHHLQRIASEESRILSGHQYGEASGRASADSGSLLRDYSFSMGAMGPGPGPRPELHSAASRGSMILYRLSASVAEDGVLAPPPGLSGLSGHGMNRSSVYSNSGDSIVSLADGSKYPLVGLGIGGTGAGTPPRSGTGVGPRTPTVPGTPGAQGSIGTRGGSLSLAEIGKSQGGLVAYVYDPDEDADADELDAEEEEWIRMVGGRVVGDYYHSSSIGKGKESSEKANVAASTRPPPSAPQQRLKGKAKSHLSGTAEFPWRGLMNVTTLVVLIFGLLSLFIVFPVTKTFSNNGVDAKILGNTRINATGQAVDDFVVPGAVGSREVQGGGMGILRRDD